MCYMYSVCSSCICIVFTAHTYTLYVPYTYCY